MDNVRLILIMTLIFIGLLLYQAWEADYGTKPKSVTTAAEPSRTPTVAPEIPKAVNEQATPSTLSTISTLPELPNAQPAKLLPSQGRIHVKTDLLNVEIDTRGGDIRRVSLLGYPINPKAPENPVRLLNDEMPSVFVAQSGLLPADSAPTHQAHYHSEKTSYQLNSNEKTLEVKLTWQNEQGLKVNKIYKFQRGSYVIEVQHLVINGSTKPWQGRVYGQFQRTEVAEEGQSSFVQTYMGGAISSPTQRYEKIPFTNIKDDSFNKERRPAWAGGWAAMLQHYFVAAWIPEREQLYQYYTNLLPEGNRYVLGLYGPTQIVMPDNQQLFTLKFYAGPKLQDKLAALAPGLELTADYGWLWFIAQPLFWLLEQIQHIVGNWGWAIIILTIFIKLAFFHLSATSYKSMANMRRVQPRLMALKERYGDDKARLNQAMMEMYKREKINPLGGCLPILVQIPVFIALYWVLLESVELRQAHFMGWISDLSSPDPYFVLPLIMGATMFLQNHLNPAPIDPVQQKVMMMLPLIFTVFFAFFPSGLVLYWVINNALSIAQQWVITKKIAGDV